MQPKHTSLTIQKWGNSLAIRIPAKIARSAHFYVGTPVAMTEEDGVVTITQSGEPNLTLTERLALFDLKDHGGEHLAEVSI